LHILRAVGSSWATIKREALPLFLLFRWIEGISFRLLLLVLLIWCHLSRNWVQWISLCWGLLIA
jgi:hypothetical protein